MDNKTTTNEEELLKMAEIGNSINRGKLRSVDINSKRYRLRPINMRQSAEIANLAFDAKFYQEQMNSEKDPKKAKKLNLEFRKIPAKMAAHYLLGRRLRYVPLLYWITWRRLYRLPEEVSAMINSVEITGGTDKDFFSANLECIKFQLALSMNQVGEIVKQKQEREASAERMLDEDALPKKEGVNKSGTHLRQHSR